MGKPHFCITTTCNPNHPLILKALPLDVSPSDLPDSVFKIFRQNELQLTKILIEMKLPVGNP